MYTKKKKAQQNNNDKFETRSTTSTVGTIAPSFINEEVNQWPSWTKKPVNLPVKHQSTAHKGKSVAKKVKANPIGFDKTPKVEGIVYEKAEKVPHGGFIGRGSTRYYKYYVDEANDIVYFYPFQVISI